MALTETLKILFGIPVLLIAGLSVLARKRPDVHWLQAFNLQARLTEEQRDRIRKTQNRMAGAQLVLLGIITPIGYLGVKVMFFSNIETGELVVVSLLGATCIVLGFVALVRNK